MRWTILICLLCGLCGTSVAQVTGLYSLRALNPYADHVAFAGLDRAFDAKGSFRSQWNEVEGNPVSQYIGVAAPIDAIQGAIGARVQNETLGAYGQTRLSLSYNYILPTRIGLFSLGGAISSIQSRLDGLRLRTPEGNYEGLLLQHNDNLLTPGTMSAQQIAFEVSGYFRSGQLEMGVSAHNINEPSLSIGNAEQAIATFQRSIHFIARYNTRILRDWIATPTILIHYTATSLQAAALVQFNYRDGFSAGIGIRGYDGDHLESVLMSAGTRLGDRLWVHYAYDFGLASISRNGQGSHEILLSYRLNLKNKSADKPKIIYNPRYIDCE